ncbi:M60 family metallopeptidase [Sunxiuqinia elliptica]|uniref:F5/8 type C domain-containing protein n=1 Tax=Sunxiuqinia elliptica TaxID=655355 RepID=A0A4R6GPP9_9BACT|nr:M60 family metallopeptidase [Sunxiuqinia elliptica]TDN97126.1 F5/8 type C domain-containing protein [Sunxiuqinia elliptica]TDO60689.1 F5/8 type C domain-containing protein [Sunxiuqinia elliptica]
MRKEVILYFCIYLLFISCSKKTELSTPDIPQLEFSFNSITIGRLASKQVVGVTTNVENLVCETGVDWCVANYENGEVVIEAFTNPNADTRAAIVFVSSGNLKKSITVSQLGLNSYEGDIKGDIKLEVKKATASSVQPGAEIKYSFDGNFDKGYHSNWSNTATNYFPIRLTYEFENIPTMDYIIYYPRKIGVNGNIKEFELWIATEDNPTLTKYGDYNFNGSSASSRVTFSKAITKPATIQLVVKSGAGDGQGFVSCAEMEFYRKNPDNFDFLSIFKDNSCSELKPGITESDVMAISNDFFKDMALEIFRNEYNQEFRIQEYRPWQDPAVMAKVNRTSTYSLRDNPTGIYVTAGEEFVFFANNPYHENVSILIQDLENGFGGNSYPVANGLNKINVTSGGLVYVMYHTKDATEDPVKINFVTGTINGYFDSQKHNTEDWDRLLSNAGYKHFDILGEYAHLTFPTEKFRENTPDGLALINKYDELVRLEWEFMGLFKYNKNFNNRMYFHVDYTDSYMYSTSYRTAYVTGTMNELCSQNKFATSPWGPAHEVGHSNQTRPGLKWIGMTEVTNNIHSMHIQTSWGNQSRLIVDGVYNTAFNNLLNRGIPHNGYDGDKGVFVKLVPFWQLKLYLLDALGKDDFYKDLYEYMRNQDYSQATNDGFYQLDFVRAACRIANLDLTQFFKAWGFLEPVDITVKDYATKQFTITQNEIDDLKAEIAAKNYPKPEHSNIFEITDNNVSNYR